LLISVIAAVDCCIRTSRPPGVDGAVAQLASSAATIVRIPATRIVDFNTRPPSGLAGTTFIVTRASTRNNLTIRTCSRGRRPSEGLQAAVSLYKALGGGWSAAAAAAAPSA
jgi:hypothetical protein